MYQNFFYLTVALSMIVSTLVMLFLTVLIYRKNFAGRSSRRTSRMFDRLERLEDRVDFKMPLELKIEIYTQILLLYELDSDEFKLIKEKIETLEKELEQFDEARD